MFSMQSLLSAYLSRVCPDPTPTVDIGLRSAVIPALPSLLSLLVRPPGVPDIEAGGVDRPGAPGVEGTREEEARGEPGRPKRESTRSLTSFRAVVKG